MNTAIFPTTVSARQIQRDYKSIFLQVNKTNQPVMVISNNQPQVVILSLNSFARYAESFNREELWKTIASIQADNRKTNENEVEADVLAAIKRVRMKEYGKSPRRSR